MTLVLTAVRQEVNNLESSSVVYELELTLNCAWYGSYGSYNAKVTNTSKKVCLGGPFF